MQRGKILGIVPKTYLPNYNEFYEQRWFTSAADIPEGSIWCCGQQIPLVRHSLFHTTSCTFGVELCEDVWAPVPPSTQLTMLGADIIFNLSASNDYIGKYAYLRQLVSQQSARCICGYVYAGAGFGESTQDVVFSGKAMICENGTLLAEAVRHEYTPQLVISDIDVQRLHTDRRTNTTFAHCAREVKEMNCRRVSTSLV